MAFQRRPSTQLLLGTSPKDPVLHLDILSQPQIVPIGLNTWTPVKGPRNQNPPNALDPVRALVQGRYESYGVPFAATWYAGPTAPGGSCRGCKELLRTSVTLQPLLLLRPQAD